MKRNLEYVQFQGIGSFSSIIRWWTKSKESHSAVLDRERIHTKQLIEQWPHGKGMKSWMDYSDFSGHKEGTPYQIWSLEVDETDYDWIMDQYRHSAFIKKQYDWDGIKAFGFIGDHDPDKTFCSEEMILHLATRMGWDRVKPEKVHPGMFGTILQIAGAKLTYSGVV